MADEEVPVLIVGGSLVGLSASLFLSRHGVEHLVAERHPGTAIHPRAALFNQRTIEIYRSVGIEPEVLREADKEFVQNGAIMSVESLGGKELDWYDRYVNAGFEDLSPSKRIFITQIGLEPVLREAAAASGSRLQYSSEVVSLDADEDGATAVIRARDDGSERTVRARYVIAADGTRSPTRERLGIGMNGHGTFSDSITIYFRADIRPLMGDRNLSVIYVFNPALQGFFRFSIDGQAGFLVVNSALDSEGKRSTRVGEDMGEERCIEYVRTALGSPDIPVEIENVQRWSAQAVWAERFRDGRIFLAGDSAHVMPPTGGFGGNTGVSDAYNLAWKLAYVLDGRAGEQLLDSYDAERRPVGEATVEQAYTRYVLRLDPELGKDDLVPFLPDPCIELGHRQRSEAIALEADDDDAPFENPHEPSGRPGTRAPHVWLDRDGGSVSTLDLFGRNFVLLAGAEGESWRETAREAGERSGVPVDVHVLAESRFADAYGVGSGGAALVRPDGFIAWRAQQTGSEPALGDALERALGRTSSVVS
jgi:2-polyprenyl-6-methoxyphenol hydroxylase-like FAD-dependent oxidoreductase